MKENEMTTDNKKRSKNLTIVVLAIIAAGFYLGFIFMVSGR
jgi:flagellar basal body-associated protein FliL